MDDDRQRGTVAIHSDRPELPICRDITTDELASVTIGSRGKKLWVCVDGRCMLRVKASEIVLTDLRVEDAIRQQ